MSAFAGIVHLGGVQLESDAGSRLAAGLDGHGFASAVSLHQRGCVAVAFRQRLVMSEDRLDRPPHVEPDTRTVSVFDGRLDNRAELIRACGLEKSGPVSDAAVASHAYRMWGSEAPGRLLGSFAWAVWDERERQLLLARDHGVFRALFYFQHDSLVVFATTYRALFTLPQVPRILDERSVVDVIATTPDLSDRSLYRNVRWVRPAEQVLISPGRIRQSRFWQPLHAPAPGRGDDEVRDAARGLFDEAVACRDRSIGPATVLLSGGYDSSAVAATLARRRNPDLVHGLTAVPADDLPDAGGNTYRDERPLVEGLARRYGNLHVTCLASTAVEGIEDDPSETFLAAQAPLRAPGNSAWFHRLIRRAQELGAPVVMTGGFGNMTLTANGYSRVGELLAAGFGLGALGELLAMRRHMSGAGWSAFVRQALGGRLPWLRRMKRRLAGRDWSSEWRRRTALNPDFQQDPAFQAYFLENAVVELDTVGPGGRFRELDYILQRSRMQVEAVAALRAATGVDIWDPYADRRIIDFCLSLPDDQFLRHGRHRFLARRIFADRLPAEILSNKRRGAQNSDWYLRLPQQRERLEGTLDQLERSALAGRILDLPRLRRMLLDMPTDPADLRRTGNAYKVMFTRAVHVGRFLAWYERSN